MGAELRVGRLLDRGSIGERADAPLWGEVLAFPKHFFNEMTDMKNPHRISATALAVAGLMVAAAANAQEVQTVKIAHAGPTSGGIAHIGKDTENGVRMAIEELNAQNLSIGGKPVKFELVAEDDGGDPKQATAVAQKLCDMKVAGVVLGGDLKTDFLAANDQVLGVQIVNRQTNPVLGVLADVGDATRRGAGVGDAHGLRILRLRAGGQQQRANGQGHGGETSMKRHDGTALLNKKWSDNTVATWANRARTRHANASGPGQARWAGLCVAGAHAPRKRAVGVGDAGEVGRVPYSPR